LVAGILIPLFLFPSACAELESDESGRSKTKTSTAQSSLAPDRPDVRRYGGPANYITNPSFEKRVVPWQPWENAAVEITTSFRKIAHAAARVGVKTPGRYGIVLANAVNSPAAGDEFVFSVWLRSADRRKRVVILLQGARPNGDLVVIAKATRQIPSKSWRRVTVRGRVRLPDVTGINIYVQVLNSIGVADAFFVDAASLTPA